MSPLECRVVYGTLKATRKERIMEFFLMATGSVLAMLFVFWMIISKDKFLDDELNQSPWEGDK